MMRALYTAASGMMAQQLNIDNITNNLANVNSTAYKKSRVEFSDLLYANMQDSSGAPEGAQIGLGVRSATTQRLYNTGTLEQTGNNFDVAIQDQPGAVSFMSVTLPSGEIVYTRDGALQRDGQGNLTTSAGFPIGIRVPADVTNVTIDPNGQVKGTPVAGTEPQLLGQIKLTRFLNPAGLQALGGNLYRATTAAGEKITATPGENGTGTVAQGFLEKSNVNVVEEMINIIQAQRAYEMNSKSVQSADEMMRMTNQLQKG